MTVGLMGNSSIFNKLLIGVIGILLVVLSWLGYQYIHMASNLVDIGDGEPSTTVVRQIREVSELTTATFEMDAVVPVSEKGFLILESKLLYIAHGNVRVGVNLNQLQADNVKLEGDQITVTLPPLKILDSKLDLAHSTVYSYDRGFLGWGPDVVNLQAQAQREALTKVEKAACQDWLLKEASDRVEKTVDHLLSQVLKDKGYKITVKTQLPAEGSCGI
ncbi:DUF4230 domain-containing protein [Nostoc punctiforme FACHB-252]|uniref:DUF4230 domain-containing protein n=1 Tax=Nostoc punctiforme FACHB-252 TaxID=1357509 RepID=A0ABR8H891_NOSPU|nr:DUF4230 domain-containing protein [Nostoc punctiforme]MBD2612062.1 DUF4230 domain-containing protein [Nostoc punctiforme FACHB-252]